MALTTIDLIAWCVVFALSIAGFVLADRRWFVGPFVIALVILVLTIARAR